VRNGQRKETEEKRHELEEGQEKRKGREEPQ